MSGCNQQKKNTTVFLSHNQAKSNDNAPCGKRQNIRVNSTPRTSEGCSRSRCATEQVEGHRVFVSCQSSNLLEREFNTTRTHCELIQVLKESLADPARAQKGHCCLSWFQPSKSGAQLAQMLGVLFCWRGGLVLGPGLQPLVPDAQTPPNTKSQTPARAPIPSPCPGPTPGPGSWFRAHSPLLPYSQTRPSDPTSRICRS